MALVISWRRVALVVALVMAVAAGVVMTQRPRAGAQEPAFDTITLSGIPVTAASRGFASLGEGSGTSGGVLGIACTGMAPQSGTGMPASVITNLRANDTRLRIFRPNGTGLVGNARVNCVIDVEVTPAGEAAVERLEAKAATTR